MNIKVNGKEVVCPDGSNIEAVLELLKVDTGKGIAIALKNTVIPRGKWNETLLTENDELVIISATRGG